MSTQHGIKPTNKISDQSLGYLPGNKHRCESIVMARSKGQWDIRFKED